MQLRFVLLLLAGFGGNTGAVGACERKVDDKGLTAFLIEGKSMLPTLGPGDIAIFDKNSYENQMPLKNDIVAIQFKTRLSSMVKRVVATGGDRISLDETDGLRINDSLSYIPDAAKYNSKNYQLTKRFSILSKQIKKFGNKVPKGKILVLGDNPLLSLDSARFGFLNMNLVSGKLVVVKDSLGKIKRAEGLPNPDVELFKIERRNALNAKKCAARKQMETLKE